MVTNDKKLVLLVGILAAGIFAATFAGSQLLGANAQTTNNGNHTGSQPVVSSADDVNCTEEVSAVHCVEGNIAVATSHESVPISTVSSSGTATTKVQPDKFSLTVGVETNGTTAEEAASANADLVAKIVAALKALGISEDDISTSSYSVYPVYEYKQTTDACIMIYPPPPECQPKQDITGYRASSSLSVTLDADGDIEAGGVIDTSIEAGANTVQGTFFFLSQERQQEVQDSLIGKAIANARHRADIAADAVDMHISGVRSISLSDVYFPIFARDDSLQAEGGTQILPAQQEVTMTVSVVYHLSNGIAGSSEEENNSGSSDPMTIARNFILSKLPGLGIQIDNELDLHTDMVVHVSETEFHLDYGIVDTNDQVHDGHIEVVNGEVTVANLDGESIL